ncbi:MAG: lipoprotein [Chromatiales bacterium]
MICWARYLMLLVVVILGVSSMLSACGQKGPLVLPDETEQGQPPEQSQPQGQSENAD